MFEFISKLTFSKGIYISFLILGNLIAPYWFLYQFFPQMVTGNEIFQQVIFSLAISVPLLAPLFVIQMWKGYKNNEFDIKRKDESSNKDQDIDDLKFLFKYIGMAALDIAAAFYILCAVSYFFPIVRSIPIQSCIIIFSTQIVVGCFSALLTKRKKEKSETPPLQ